MKTQTRASGAPLVDLVTLVSVAGLAYVLGAALHEHGGHALACVGLGGKVRELNAFFVDCNYQGMSDVSIRLVALAGPLVSFLVGIVAFFALGRVRGAATPWRLLLWLLGSIGYMTATGYLLFSGLLGLGDFGTSRDGMLFGASPEWAWRGLIVVLGLAGYAFSMLASIRAMDEMIGGGGLERVHRALRIALTSYVTGGLVCVLIGLFNPLGIVIVLISAAAASLGGTSGIAWEMTLMQRNRQTGQEPLKMARDWRWVAVSAVVVLLYAIALGPSIKL